ncbi:chemokine-like protein TAFA-5 isoform X4 [Hemicordylus capensis]|uniref:chemokine-like protein TAFA-5 isoform X4 n=1 Tax=Hemicordylus capensis TaxID=884348 RepID=UPI0023031967|nr:chemokine-like protein TAFA-5 isoform X4 [Hemicordylus capensis]
MLFGFGDVVASMAPSPRRSSGKDANALPSASSTFWAIMILVGLLIAYCSQLAAGTCEIVTLDRDSSQPRRTIARQTARCACKKGQIAGTTRARPACVDEKKKEQHWLSGECLVNFHTGNKYRRELPRCSFLSCKELFHDHNCLGKVFQPGRTRETAIFLFAQGHLLLALDATASLLTLWFVVMDCWPISRIIKTKQWCEMLPCLEGEGCDLLINKSGWTCTQPGGRIKTTTVS